MKVLVPVAHGSESLETVTIVNILRRAGIDTTVASIESDLTIKATLDIRLQADRLLVQVEHEAFDLIAVPGGTQGAEALSRCTQLIDLLRRQQKAGRYTAAICAAPAIVLATHGLLEGRRATCYPAFREKVSGYVDEPVVVDGKYITSAGPGTAMSFALKLVEVLAGAEKARQVATTALVGSYQT